MATTTSKRTWTILSNAYKSSKKIIVIKFQSLWKEFDTLLMKEGENIQAFFTRVSNIINQIRIYRDMIPDIKIVQKRSFIPKYDHIVAVIEESKDLSKVSLTELMVSPQAYEERMHRISEPPLQQAFQAKLIFSINGENKREQSQ